MPIRFGPSSFPEHVSLCANGAHHWLIDTPSPGSKVVEGVCKRCHAHKEYDPFGPEDMFYRSWSGKVAQ